jgi:hypothetical protein
MAVTSGDLRAALRAWPDFVRLRGPEETPACVRLGSLEIDRSGHTYRFGYSYDISETSRLLKRAFEFPDMQRAGFAVIFRQFDRFTEEDDPPEFAVGWVGVDEEDALDGWLDRLNGMLRERREHG